MKKATALIVVLMFAVAAWAYQASSGASTKASTQAKTSTASTTKSTTTKAAAASAKESTITGCLSGPIGEGYYEVRNASHRSGMQVNAMDGLKAHVGHKVKLTGTWEEEIPEVQEERFNVSKVEMIAETCTVPAAAKKTSSAKPAASTPK